MHFLSIIIDDGNTADDEDDGASGDDEDGDTEMKAQNDAKKDNTEAAPDKTDEENNGKTHHENGEDESDSDSSSVSIDSSIPPWAEWTSDSEEWPDHNTDTEDEIKRQVKTKRFVFFDI